MYIPVMPLALLCNCFNVASLWLVLVGWVSLFGGIPVFLGMVVYICFRPYTGLFSLRLHVSTADSDSLSDGFLRFASLCGVVP